MRFGKAGVLLDDSRESISCFLKLAFPHGLRRFRELSGYIRVLGRDRNRKTEKDQTQQMETCPRDPMTMFASCGKLQDVDGGEHHKIL